MARWIKAVAATASLLLIGFCALALYARGAAKTHLTQSWPQVKGKDLPIPFPLTEEELDALRAENSGAVAAPDAAEDGAPPVVTDPLAGLDLDGIAMERAVARGQRLAEVRLGCADCHGPDGAGTLIADALPVWRWYAPNITGGGVTADYSGADWDRIIRHGIRRDGISATMPAIDFTALSDREVSDLAAWARSLPAVSTVQPPTEFGPVGTALVAFGKIPMAAEHIDHDASHPELPPEPAVDAAFGEHVSRTCVGCHRMDYSGGPIPGGDPAWPPAANLTPHAEGLSGWTEDDFMRAMREAQRPDGSSIDPVMPVRALKHMDDTELKAVFLYLQALPAKPTGR